MRKNNIIITPSIMCADLCNLETSVQEIRRVGFKTLHIDMIDGHFSPSMPLGIDTVKQLREITDMNTKRHRSEEHTSELQSRFDLVCRLLLENKNKSSK